MVTTAARPSIANVLVDTDEEIRFVTGHAHGARAPTSFVQPAMDYTRSGVDAVAIGRVIRARLSDG